MAPFVLLRKSVWKTSNLNIFHAKQTLFRPNRRWLRHCDISRSSASVRLQFLITCLSFVWIFVSCSWTELLFIWQVNVIQSARRDVRKLAQVRDDLPAPSWRNVQSSSMWGKFAAVGEQEKRVSFPLLPLQLHERPASSTELQCCHLQVWIGTWSLSWWRCRCATALRLRLITFLCTRAPGRSRGVLRPDSASRLSSQLDVPGKPPKEAPTFTWAPH